MNPDPLFPIGTNIKINPGERSPSSDGIRPVEKDARHVTGPLIRSLHPIEQSDALEKVRIKLRQLVSLPAFVEKMVSLPWPNYCIRSIRQRFHRISPQGRLR